MPAEGSQREGRVRAWRQRRSERRQLKRQRKREALARPPDSDPSGAWARQRGSGPGGMTGFQ
jgi:hypothetical protein